MGRLSATDKEVEQAAEAEGRHEELLKSCPLYETMWKAHIGAKDGDAMIEVILKIWRLAGAERSNISKSVFVSFLNAVFHMFEVSAVYFVIAALTNGKTGGGTAWLSLILMLVSIVGNAVTSSISKMQQIYAGYFMAANERIKLGSLLNGVPMGFSARTVSAR